jgi:type II secretory ATPase GspE/PulE/Tfp pilus assembly ATPase PilB-like protein
MAVFHDEEQNKKIAEIHAHQEEAAVKALADTYGIGYVDLAGIGINTDGLLLIPEEVSRTAKIACFGMVGKKLSIAVQSPTDEKTIEQIDELETKGFVIHLYLVSLRSLEKAWARYADVGGSLRTRGGLLDITDEGLQELAKKIHSNSDIRDTFMAMVGSQDAHKVSKLMEIIFGAAIGTKSSDVHIEAAETFSRLRFRQDGVLQDIVEFPLEIYKSINSRIKLLSEMKLTSTATAQDGRFTIMYKGIEIEIRTSLIPGPYGESIVMRLLNPEGLAKDLSNLGVQNKLLDILQKEIEKPNGMILNTGPTGSGKTTTLYSFLKKVYTPEIKILTIEDPIEYHLPGITQTQVDHEKGYDFSSGLRAAMRQDPDVIMVGEIRDKETASTAINASLTGHLVLSTLHTNNAAGAIPRLIELGVSSKILPDALTVTMAQRMVRTLCEFCKAPTALTPDEDKLIRAIINNAETSGKDYSYMNITQDGPLSMYKPVGCDKCDHIGYKGRVGLFEAILIDDKVADVIATNPTERAIKHGSLHQGIFTMVEDGVSKILSGITTIEEVQSTVDMVEDLPEGWNQQKVEPSTTAYVHTINITEDKDPIPAIPVNQEIQFRAASLSDDGALIPQNDSATESVLPIKELVMLVDYLKTLEHEQNKHPEQGIRQKITDLKETIVNLLVRSDVSKWIMYDPTVVVHNEVEKIVNGLEALEQHQSRKPNVGVASQLRDIRNTIENLVAKG